jgi:hypothetical protein
VKRVKPKQPIGSPRRRREQNEAPTVLLTGPILDTDETSSGDQFHPSIMIIVDSLLGPAWVTVPPTAESPSRELLRPGRVIRVIGRIEYDSEGKLAAYVATYVRFQRRANEDRPPRAGGA